jgi:hypothetical protein
VLSSDSIRQAGRATDRTSSSALQARAKSTACAAAARAMAEPSVGNRIFVDTASGVAATVIE